jgi:hypothetical protein
MERKGIEADEDYWLEHAAEFSELWWLYAYAEYLREKACILIDRVMDKPQRDISDALYLIDMFHFQVTEFSQLDPNVQIRYPREYLAGCRNAYEEDLVYWNRLPPLDKDR